MALNAAGIVSTTSPFAPGDPLTASFADATSGIAGGSLRVVSGVSPIATATISPGQSALSLKPTSGAWPTTNVLLTGFVEDVAGNVQRVSYVFKAATPVAPTAPKPKPQPVPKPLVQTAANSRLLCLEKGAKARTALAKPKACSTLGAADSKKKAVNLVKLKWTGWGTAKAKATAVSIGFKTKKTKLKVKVTLSSPTLNSCGGFSYTALKIVSKRGTIKQTLPATCTG